MAASALLSKYRGRFAAHSNEEAILERALNDLPALPTRVSETWAHLALLRNDRVLHSAIEWSMSFADDCAAASMGVSKSSDAPRSARSFRARRSMGRISSSGADDWWRSATERRPDRSLVLHGLSGDAERRFLRRKFAGRPHDGQQRAAAGDAVHLDVHVPRCQVTQAGPARPLPAVRAPRTLRWGCFAAAGDAIVALGAIGVARLPASCRRASAAADSGCCAV
jgi:hypothetical protein